MFKICPTCKKEFAKPKNESKKDWLLKRTFCSKKCVYPNKVTLECKECSGYFKVRNYRKNTAHFCSQDCSHQFRNQGLTPKNERVRKSAKYKAWRTLVFERDNYTCQMCGIKNGLGKTVYFHADHIKPFALYPELRFNIDNGRTLCVLCHKKTPTYGRSRIYRVQLATA